MGGRGRYSFEGFGMIWLRVGHDRACVSLFAVAALYNQEKNACCVPNAASRTRRKCMHREVAGENDKMNIKGKTDMSPQGSGVRVRGGKGECRPICDPWDGPCGRLFS